MKKLVFIFPILVLCCCINRQQETQKQIETFDRNSISAVSQKELDNKKITPDLFYINESSYEGLHPRNDMMSILVDMGFKKTDSARINLSWEYESPSSKCDCIVYELNKYKITALRLLCDENINDNPVRYEILFPSVQDKEEFIEKGKRIGLNREDADFKGYYFYGQNGTYMADINDTIFIGFFH